MSDPFKCLIYSFAIKAINSTFLHIAITTLLNEDAGWNPGEGRECPCSMLSPIKKFWELLQMTLMIPDLLSKILSLSKYLTEISRTQFLRGTSNWLWWKLGTYWSLGDKLFSTCESLKYRVFVFLPSKEKGFPHFGEHMCAINLAKYRSSSALFTFPVQHSWDNQSSIGK